MIVLLTAAALMLPTIPGAYNGDVRQTTATSTICIKGWSATVRPPVSYTTAVKRSLLATLHLSGTIRDYQLDHLVSLSLGGSPTSPKNLWMQPIRQALRDDRLELALHRAVCSYALTLRDAQRLEISYKRVYG